jgi:hypothetical protein
MEELMNRLTAEMKNFEREYAQYEYTEAYNNAMNNFRALLVNLRDEMPAAMEEQDYSNYVVNLAKNR